MDQPPTARQLARQGSAALRMLAKEPAARPTMEQVAAQLQRLAQGGREAPSLHPAESSSDGEERATVAAKALGGRRASAEISGSDLAVTTALRVKKLATKGSRAAGDKEASQDGVDSGAFDPTSPGDPAFARKLGSIIPDTASTVPVQSMRLNDIHPAAAKPLPAAAVDRLAEAAAGSVPRSVPGLLSGASWVPMEIVKTDYASTPELPDKKPAVAGRGRPAQKDRRQVMLGLVVLAALLLIAMTTLLLLRGAGS